MFLSCLQSLFGTGCHKGTIPGPSAEITCMNPTQEAHKNSIPIQLVVGARIFDLFQDVTFVSRLAATRFNRFFAKA